MQIVRMRIPSDGLATARSRQNCSTSNLSGMDITAGVTVFINLTLKDHN
jgi:hypothetical protein